MDVFLLDEDNVILAPWLYVHSLHTRIPKSKTQLTVVHLLNKFVSTFIQKSIIVLHHSIKGYMNQLTFDRLCLYS